VTPSRPVVFVVLGLALVPGTGCSWIFVNKPPPDPVPVTPPVVCTTSVASPVVDTVLAAVALGTGIAAIAISSKSSESGPCTYFCSLDLSGLNTAGTVSGVILAAMAIPLAFSAGYGYSTTAECRELKDTQLACISGVEASCSRLMKSPMDDCEKSSQAACTSAGNEDRSCQDRRMKSCMEAAGWTEK
jgi:hypothetical protein